MDVSVRRIEQIPKFFARSTAFRGSGVEHFPTATFSFVAVGLH
jgi:hypothetical protein